MSSDTVNEEITLDSGEVDLRPDERGLKKITSELSQYHENHKIKKLFRIYDKKILGVGEKSDNHKKTYLVHLALLSRRPRRSFNINKKFFNFFLISVLLSCLAILLKIYNVELLPDSYTYATIILFTIIALFLLYKIVKGIRYSMIFYTAHGRIPLVEIMIKNPDKAQYKGFISAMKQNISRLKKDERFSGQGILSAEMNEHRRLFESGIITSEAYELAKKNILGKH